MKTKYVLVLLTAFTLGGCSAGMTLSKQELAPGSTEPGQDEGELEDVDKLYATVVSTDPAETWWKESPFELLRSAPFKWGWQKYYYQTQFLRLSWDIHVNCSAPDGGPGPKCLAEIHKLYDAGDTSGRMVYDDTWYFEKAPPATGSYKFLKHVMHPRSCQECQNGNQDIEDTNPVYSLSVSASSNN